MGEAIRKKAKARDASNENASNKFSVFNSVIYQQHCFTLHPRPKTSHHTHSLPPLGPSHPHPTAPRPPNAPPALLVRQGHEPLDQERHVFHLLTRKINGPVGGDEAEGFVQVASLARCPQQGRARLAGGGGIRYGAPTHLLMYSLNDGFLKKM